MNIATKNPPQSPQLEASLAIEARGIRYHYASIQALDGFNLDLSPSEKVALLGANGAGKSTFFKLVAGQQRLQEGTLKVFGRDPQSLEARDRLGVTPQNSGFPNQLKLKELLHWMKAHHINPLNEQELSELLEALEMKKYLNRYLRQFSGGQKRKVALILSLLSRPELILLDEPTTGLDVASRRHLLEWLKCYLTQNKVALLFSTHHLEEVEALADRVLLLRQGHLVGDGSLEQIKRKFGGFTLSFESSDTNKIKKLFESEPLVEVLQEGPRWILRLPVADELIVKLVQYSVNFRHLEVIADSLEEIFIKLNTQEMTL